MIRVKVAPGPKAQWTDLISVGLRPTIHVIDGTMSCYSCHSDLINVPVASMVYAMNHPFDGTVLRGLAF
jgi:hypothetical protein